MKALRLALLLSFLPAVLFAQIRGTVTDETGAPVAEAIVELLSAGGRLAVTETDAAGRFAFLASPRAAGIVVRRIGFAPARVTLASVAQPLVIVMRRRTVVVQGITTRAPGGRCVERDRPEARRLWDIASRRYASGVMMRALWAEAMRAGANVPPDSLGTMDTTRAQRTVVWGAGYRPLPSNRERFYAQRPMVGTERSYQWDYPGLESVQAWHFADVLFGELNRLDLAPAAVGDMVLEFCSQQGARPYIVGRIYLGRDTTFLKTEWRFMTERPVEQAGGEVVFMPPSPGAPLLAASGHFWRAKAYGYYQEWSSYVQWFACEDLRAECAPDQRRPLGR